MIHVPHGYLHDRAVEILQGKIDAKLTEGLASSRVVLERIERDGNLLTDFIAYLGKGNGGRPSMRFNATNAGKVFVAQEVDKTSRVFHLHPHALTQAGEKLGVPTTYIKSLAYGNAEWTGTLAAHILQEHSDHSARQRLLVRSVGDDIRGIMSDKYRRLDTRFIARAFIESLKGVGAVIYSAHADDTKWWIEAMHPRVIPIATSKNGLVAMVFGVRLASSDFADSALEVRFFMTQVVCMNGVATESILRQIHIGGRIPEEITLSRETYILDSRTQAGIVRDVVVQLFSRDSFEKRSSLIREASDADVDLEKEVKRLPRIGLLKSEANEVEKVLVRGRETDGVAGDSACHPGDSYIT